MVRIFFMIVATLLSFVCKAETDPHFDWFRSYGDSATQAADASCRDAQGNFYTAGCFWDGTTTIGGTPVKSNGHMDLLIVKYDKNGNVLWVRTAGGVKDERFYGITVDAKGNCYAVGDFDSPVISFGKKKLRNEGKSDFLVVSYDSNGNFIWANRGGRSGHEGAAVVTIDADGNCLIGGSFTSSSFGLGKFTVAKSKGRGAAFLAKYSPSGKIISLQSFGGETFGAGISKICFDKNNNLFLAGSFSGESISFGETELRNTGRREADFFLAKLDPKGKVLWARSGGGAEKQERINAMAIDETGNCFITGALLSETMSLSSITLTNSGQFDVFFAKYDASGNLVWAKNLIGLPNDFEVPGQIALAKDGGFYLTGEFKHLVSGTDTLATYADAWTDIFLIKFDTNGNQEWWIAMGGKEGEEPCGIFTDGSDGIFVLGDTRCYDFVNETKASAVKGNYQAIFIVRYGGR
jgi:hypothetical protein